MDHSHPSAKRPDSSTKSTPSSHHPQSRHPVRSSWPSGGPVAGRSAHHPRLPHGTVAQLALLLALLLPRIAIAQLDPLAELVQAVQAICGTEATPDAGESLLATEARLARAASDGKLDRDATWRFACVRAQLASVQTPSHPTYLIPSGNSWRYGASMLAARLLDDSASARAAALLAVLNADHVVAEPAAWTLGYLERAIAGGVQHPAVFRGCTMQAWSLADPTRANACAHAGLRSGGDSTLHLLTLARIGALRGDTTMALSAFLAAARAVRDTVDRVDLGWHLNWFLTRGEDSAWRALPVAETGAWVRDLMLSRDIRDGRPPGARVVEHMNRLAYVYAHFRLDVVPVQRGRLMGGVAVPEAPGGGFSVEVVTPGSATPAEAFREFVRWQIAIDDRGAVWMRFGAPDQREYYTAPSDGREVIYLKRETWRYDVDGRELVLSFENEQGDGSQDATRLVTAVVGDHFCGVTVRRCVQAERALAAASFTGLPDRFRLQGASPVGLPVNEMLDLRREDQKLIVEATTKDNNAARLPRHLETSAQFLRLWHPHSGAVLALVPWAIAADDLTDGISKKDRTINLRLELRWYDPVSGESRDSALVGVIPRPKHSGSDAFVSGVAVMPASPGVTAWSVMAVRDSTASGRVFTTAAEPLATGPLQLSDLVLGVADHGVSWAGPSGPVVLAPLATVQRKTPVQLYYQLRNTLAATELVTTVSVAKVGQLDAPPAFNVTFRHQVTPGINEVRREVDLKRLTPGRYLLTVVVSDEEGEHRVSRSTDLLVR